MRPIHICLVLSIFLLACSTQNKEGEPPTNNPDQEPPVVTDQFYLGADLSYVNEMEDCGGEYRVSGTVTNPYKVFADNNCNLVRVRLWHSPDWTNYSNFEDVKKTIRRSKDQQMAVLLDFHYSDDWADPSKQIIPKAWSQIDQLEVLADSVYQYTYRVLEALQSEGLTPEMVQVGNEINPGLLIQKEESDPLGQSDWPRTTQLLNKGLQAVKDLSEEKEVKIETMLHVAQPENALWWFEKTTANGLSDFDWIGLSYYAQWSTYDLDQVSEAISTLKGDYNKNIMIVETAYPHSFHNADPANNILGNEAVLPQYPASEEGQYQFLADLVNEVKEGGGSGVIYWEPAWISTGCSTRWGQGSHWDNATFFNAQNNNEALKAMDFFQLD